MLRSLSIENFAVIEGLTLDFSKGLNVLTGETGAGKSILIEALGFLLGARGSASWLRAGSERLSVAGVFDKEDFPKDLRAQFKLALPQVVVRRELDASGKTRAMINSQSAPLSSLAAFGEALVDFHGQHEHQALLKPSVQLECLDRFGKLEAVLEEVSSAYGLWADLCAERDSGQLSEEERRKRLDWGRFQLQEIDEARLKDGEEEEFEAALPRLKNAERLKTLAQNAYDLLYEQEASILGGLLKAERSLAELAKLDESMASAQCSVESARLSLEETSHLVGDYRDRVDLNPEKLDSMLSRLDAISRLKKKYGPTVLDILAFRERTAKDLEMIENSAARAGVLEKELARAQETLSSACEKVHRLRTKAAKKLEEALLKELKGLGMPHARFALSVELEEGRFSRTGGDAAEFLLAPNPGEPLKPVKSIASGGELSRVMLALKTVLASADRASILVFDEVDAGVGGAVARTVGEKLSGLGLTHQVLCVTHLAQVACFGGAHFHVSKLASGQRTVTSVERLEGARRLEALALMLGGRDATAASRRHAKELLESSTA